MKTHVFSDISSYDEFKTCLGDAGIVFAVSKADPTKKTLAYGRAFLDAIKDHVIPPQETEVVNFVVDMDPKTEELEMFAGALLATRQSTDLPSE